MLLGFDIPSMPTCIKSTFVVGLEGYYYHTRGSATTSNAFCKKGASFTCYHSLFTAAGELYRIDKQLIEMLFTDTSEAGKAALQAKLNELREQVGESW